MIYNVRTVHIIIVMFPFLCSVAAPGDAKRQGERVVSHNIPHQYVHCSPAELP